MVPTTITISLPFACGMQSVTSKLLAIRRNTTDQGAVAHHPAAAKHIQLPGAHGDTRWCHVTAQPVKALGPGAVMLVVQDLNDLVSTRVLGSCIVNLVQFCVSFQGLNEMLNIAKADVAFCL